MIESFSIWIGIIGFVVALATNTIIWIYTYGKLQGRMESREKELDRSLSAINNRLDSIESFNLDSDGDTKWLSKKGHTADCTEHSKIFLIETDNIKETLGDMKASIKSIQDSILTLATSGKLKGMTPHE